MAKPCTTAICEVCGQQPSQHRSLQNTDRRSFGHAACTTPKILLAVCLVACAFVAVGYWDTERLATLMEWIGTHRAEGTVLFFILTILGTVLLIPGSVLSMVAGASYGTLAGFTLVWVSTLIGQTVAFLLGRYMFRDFVLERLAHRLPAFGMVDSAIANDGWKIVILLRLSPLVPYNLFNYALATTSIGVLPYSVASAVGIVPWVWLFVHFGAVARDTAATLGHDRGDNGYLYGWGSSVWLLCGVCSLAGVGMYTKRALARAVTTGKLRTSAEGESGGRRLRDLEGREGTGFSKV